MLTSELMRTWMEIHMHAERRLPAGNIRHWKQQHVQPTREMIHEMDARYDFTLDDCNAFNAISILDYPSRVVAARVL